MNTIGQRIADARKRVGLTNQQAATKLRIDAQTLTRLENNKTVSMYTFIEACRLFDISLDEAVYGTQTDSKHR